MNRSEIEAKMQYHARQYHKAKQRLTADASKEYNIFLKKIDDAIPLGIVTKFKKARSEYEYWGNSVTKTKRQLRAISEEIRNANIHDDEKAALFKRIRSAENAMNV